MEGNAPAQQQATAPGDASPPVDPEEQLIAGGKMMSIWDHLAELRSRIVRSLSGVIVLFIVAFAFSDPIIVYLKQPLIRALPPGNAGLHFTGPLDVFLVQIKVAFLVAIVGGSPIWLYQFWKFFEPALYPRERRYVLPFIVASASLFIAGTAFCYYGILPMTLEYLIQMGSEVGTPLITIKDYVSLLLLMVGGFGIIFETPVIIVLLNLLDILSLEALVSSRRFVIVVIMVISAVLTPSPDPMSQFAMAIPCYLMFEIAILAVRLIERARRRSAAKAATAKG
jgi:sec-independent protein translocase protein TatC